jgi:hypothetical protein
MNFKIDENLPTELADDLRQFGHHADTVLDRTLLTLDKGIADVRRLPASRFLFPFPLCRLNITRSN